MATVKVACKLPNGLIIDHKGQRVTLNGANASQLVNGYGTTDVDKEFFDAWLAANKGQKLVKNGAVFGVESASKLEGATKERAGEKTGLEGLDSEKPAKGAKKDEG